MSFGQFAATSQFYLYGRQYCTATGYESSMKKYFKGGKVKDILEDPNLSMEGKVCMVTGANSGVGYEVAKYLASKKATVVMVCRSESRGKTALDTIKEETKNESVSLLVCDCSLESDVRRAWTEFASGGGSGNGNGSEASSGASGDGAVQLDVLVCNAGVLLNDLTLTSEGVETTFACHLLFGTYLLTELALPSLRKTSGSRVIVVSSGGMYNTKFPSFDIASSQNLSVKYDGNMCYAYQKRGQVLLCERWTELYPEVKFVSCHPGWTATPAVDAAYGPETVKYLQPMRTPWQGANGIAWLCVCPVEEVVSGSFYLDRMVCTKHISGPFFSEGTFTKNSPVEVNDMMTNLKLHSDATTRPSLNMTAEEILTKRKEIEALKFSLVEYDQVLDVQRFMGKWYVVASIPTAFEVGMMNCTEEYVWNEKSRIIEVTFTMRSSPTAKPTVLLQHATIANKETNTKWAINPKLGIYLPLGLTSLILYFSPNYEYCLIGLPNRGNMWLLTKNDPVNNLDENEVKAVLSRAKTLGFDMKKVVRVKHDYSEVTDGTGEGIGKGGDARAADEEQQPKSGEDTTTKDVNTASTITQEQSKTEETGQVVKLPAP